MDDLRKDLRAVSVGEVMIELVRKIDQLPGANSTFVVAPEPRAVGGAAVNVAWHLANLGWPTRLAASVGAADVRRLRAELRHRLIDFEPLAVVPGHSDTLLTLLTRDEHRSMYMLAELPQDYSVRLQRACANATLIVLNGGRHAQVREFYASDNVRQGATHLIFNPSYAITEYSGDELWQVLLRVDVTVVNEDEYRYLKDAVGDERLAEYLRPGDRLLLATRGAAGVAIFSAAGISNRPSHIQRRGLFLGAGDAFVAGLASALASSGSLGGAVEVALDAAAEVVRTGAIRVRLGASTLRPSAS